MNRRSGLNLDEFKPVAPGVFGIEAAGAGEGFVVCNFHVVAEQEVAEFVEVGHSKSRMGFLGGVKICFDADMKLLVSALKPAAASGTQRSGLFDFAQSQE